MSDRISTLTVALDKDYRDDDVEALINAIRMMKGVIAVTGEVVNVEAYSTRMRITREMTEKLYKVIEEINGI